MRMDMELLWDVILDSLIDGVKLLPFLLVTYLVMELLEHKAGSRMQEMVQKAGKAGPVIGSILGIFPQCGFSAAASNLYAGRIITLGTLFSIYLSTSDEMLPIMISEKAPISMILKILAAKVLVGMLAGFAVDLLHHRKQEMQIEHLCEQHHCHCEEGIWKSALHHTLEIFAYILLISFVLNLIIGCVGEEALGNLLMNRPVIGELIAGLVGLIPNCAASVVITQLYLEGVLSAGAMMTGLLAGSGVGILVLLRVNDDKKENLRIILLLYAVSVLAGIVLELLGVAF